MDRGVNNQRENRNGALINQQLAKRMTSTQGKPADSEIPGKAVYCREKEGRGRLHGKKGREVFGSSKNKTSKGTEVVGTSKTPCRTN